MTLQKCCVEVGPINTDHRLVLAYAERGRYENQSSSKISLQDMHSDWSEIFLLRYFPAFYSSCDLQMTLLPVSQQHTSVHVCTHTHTHNQDSSDKFPNPLKKLGKLLLANILPILTRDLFVLEPLFRENNLFPHLGKLKVCNWVKSLSIPEVHRETTVLWGGSGKTGGRCHYSIQFLKLVWLWADPGWPRTGWSETSVNNSRGRTSYNQKKSPC